MKTRKIAVLGLCVAGAMILSYVESFFSLGIPGLRAGLPNIIILFLMYKMSWKEAGAVNFVRCILVSLLFTSVLSLAYSLAGGILSLAVMAILKKTDKFSPIAVSIAGGIAHNAGQIGVAVAVTETAEIAYYLPVLTFGGCVAGIVIGIAGGLMLKRFEKIKL